jgi:bacillithiol synthase
VIGPGEAAYLAQVEAVYEDFGVFAPVRYPRPQVILIEPRVARNLAKYRIALSEVLALKRDELVERVVRRDMAQGELKAVQDLRQRQIPELADLETRIAKPGTAAEGAFRKLRQAMDKGYDSICERLLYQAQQDERHVSQALVLLSNSLRPAELPQERRLNPIIPFALNYGPGWVGSLFDRIQIDPTADTQVIELAQLFQNANQLSSI